MCSLFVIHVDALHPNKNANNVFTPMWGWYFFQYLHILKWLVMTFKEILPIFSMPPFSDLFLFFSLLLSLGFECVSVHVCVSSDCLPLTNWSVFLSVEWQVPVCLTIDRQPLQHAHAVSHLPYSQMGLCPPSPDKLSLGPQINIQAKH